MPLGSISELPADSCREIKASEGTQAVSGNYWLDSTSSGNAILARCDMKNESTIVLYLLTLCDVGSIEGPLSGNKLALRTREGGGNRVYLSLST